MRRAYAMLIASALFCLGCIALNGCTSNQDTSDEALLDIPPGAATQAILKKLDVKEYATISGQVLYAGADVPARPLIAAIDKHEDRDLCHRGDDREPTWIVDPGSRGVANVVVWVNPPRG